MKKLIFSSVLSGCLFCAAAVYAQLPANPWDIHPNDGYFGDAVSASNAAETPDAPVYRNNSSNGEILPVDPWARARDKTNTKTWRGSGQHGKLNYVGEATTFGDAMGQEMIAPEVNRHNMLVMTQHLRNLGYKIPAGYDEKIKNMPSAYRAYLREAYDSLNPHANPMEEMFVGLMGFFENETGLDIENILFNTMDILGTD